MPVLFRFLSLTILGCRLLVHVGVALGIVLIMWFPFRLSGPYSMRVCVGFTFSGVSFVDLCFPFFSHKLCYAGLSCYALFLPACAWLVSCSSSFFRFRVLPVFRNFTPVFHRLFLMSCFTLLLACALSFGHCLLSASRWFRARVLRCSGYSLAVRL